MNTTLKHTLVAMATAALGFAAGCGKDADNPAGAEAASGGETSTAQGQGGCHAGGCHAGGCGGHQAQPAEGAAGSTSEGTSGGTTTTP